jgi:hypothetical protein
MEHLSLKDQIEHVSNIHEQYEYNLKAARNPQKKRTHKVGVVFWGAVLKSLKELEELKNK